METDTKPERLFFALWPSPALRHQLVVLPDTALPSRHGGRHTPAQNLHLTLAFLGAVDAATRSCIERGVDDVRLAAFDLVLDRLGCFRRRGLLWVGASAIPPPLRELVAGLHGVLAGCSIAPDTREFRAHVTLVRHLRRGPRESAIPPVVWPAREFALVRSDSGVGGAKYHVLRTWALDGRDAG